MVKRGKTHPGQEWFDTVTDGLIEAGVMKLVPHGGELCLEVADIHKATLIMTMFAGFGLAVDPLALSTFPDTQ